MTDGLIYFLAIYAVFVAGLTLSEVKENQRAQRVLKPAAAFGFILIALLIGVPETLYAQLILLGLTACAFGDIFLLSRGSQKLFLAGMGAFALGHFAYLTAFVTLSVEGSTVVEFVKTGVVIFAGVGIYNRLKPHLPRGMRVPVSVYFFIRLLMVINALSLPAHGPLFLAMIGAVMFAVSDVFVGRDRFVTPTPKNAIVITPLYFGAQALIALSTLAGV
jgi:uncharacterized membrane protein YhhN